MQKRKSESTVFPKSIDLTSSKSTVYVRENIVAEDREGTTMWVFDENQYERAEYESLALEQSRADIDYLAIMTGVDL